MPLTGSTITNTAITQTVTLGPGAYPNYASPLTITSTGTVDVSPGTAIYGPTGGYITNAGLIEGQTLGVSMSGAAGTVVNTGSIVATTTANNSNTVILHDGGTVSNLGVITNAGHGTGDFAIQFALSYPGNIINGQSGSTAGLISAYHIAIITGVGGGPSTVTNFGTIESTGTYNAISLRAGGSVFNGAPGATTALITGPQGGVYINGGAGTVVNFGTILGSGSTFADGIALNAGGLVTNSGTIASYGKYAIGIFLSTGGTVNNAATGSILGSFGGIVANNAEATISNFGIIEGTGTSGFGVSLTEGGTLTNSGMIAGAAGGVDISNASGTVINLGTITGTSGTDFQVTGVALYGGKLTNGSAVGTNALIYGVQYGANIGSDAAGTVVNFGSIVAGATGGEGLRLKLGGTIDNLGTITGPGAGIFLDIASTVTNGQSGTAKGYISGQIGVDMNTTGTVTNYGRIVGAAAGIGVNSFYGGTVHNFGTITGGAGVDFNFQNSGGIVVNGKSGSAAGLISGVNVGVSIETGGGTVTNYALITGGIDGVNMFGTAAAVLNNFGTLNGGSRAAYLGGTAGARVLNSGTINGGAEGIHTRDAAASVTNSSTGVIEGDTGNAIDMTDGGTVINQGKILAPNSTQAAINISNAPGSVNNSGSISGGTGILLNNVGAVSNSGTIDGTGPTGDGVDLAAGGNVNNVSAASLIDGNSIGVYISGGVGKVSNAGTIDGGTDKGVALYDGGTVTNSGTIIGGADKGVAIYNAIGAVKNSGTIIGANDKGVALYLGGLVTNSGNITGSNDKGVAIYGAIGTVSNSGTITGGNDKGVALYQGGTVTNSGRITGSDDKGVAIYSAIGTVKNSGTIVGTYSYGVALYGGGSVVNTAGLIGGAAGVYIGFTAGTVTNFATIAGTGTVGTTTGVILAAGGTITDFGTINGASGTAISFGGTSANLLILEPGYHLGGQVIGSTSGGATNTLELGSTASVGTVSAALANEFVNFGTVTVDAGARWTLTGATSLAGITLTDFGTLTNAGSLTGGTLIVDPASLINTGSIGTTVTLVGGSYLNNKPTGIITTSGTAVYGIGGAVSVSNRGIVISTGGDGVSLFSGSITNGATNATGAVISGSHFGVQIQNGSGKVVNFGSITSSTDTGIWLNAGTVINGPSGATHALISGPYDGVFIASGRGTVVNFATVASGNWNDGVCLYAGGSVSNGQSGATAALISGYAWGVEVQNSAGTVLNLGTVESTGTAGFTSGVFLKAGGTVIDAGTIRGSSGIAIDFGGTSSNRLILDPGYHFGGTAVGSTTAGATNALELGPGSGTGTVSSVIATEFVHFGAINVDGGANWVLASNNKIAAGETLTVNGTLTDLGTLTNAGVINGGGGDLIIDPATLVNTGSIGVTVTLAGGSVLINKTAGKITQTTAFGSGVFGSGGAVTVVNQGQIAAPAGFGVQLVSGGRVTNRSSGSITAGYSAVNIMGGAGTVVNYGTVAQTGITGGTAIYLSAGGRITNYGIVTAVASTGTNGSHGIGLRGAGTITNLGRISVGGTHGDGVKINDTGTLINSGTVTGASSAVQLRGPGSVINGQSGVAGGLLVGYFAGIAALNDAATFVNFGPIVNFATIASTSSATSYNGFSLGAIIGGAGSINNSGLVTGSAAGIVLGGTTGGGTVVNSGRIIGGAGTGVRLTSGGRVTNQSSGSITGADGGVYILGGIGTVNNSGTVASSTNFWDGVFLDTGGIVSNSGSVSGLDGVDLRGSGTVTNSGMIIGSGSGNVGGVFLGFNYSAGAFRVNNTGSITSSATGVLMRGAGTIDNGSSAATGATISGNIGIQIFGVGTVVNFGTLTGTGGIAVSLGAGDDRVVIEAGSVLNGAVAGFHIGDTFDLPFMSFSSTGTATLKSGNVLRVVENGGTFNIKLDPSQNFTGDFFHLGGDGSGGTLVTENHTPPAPYSISPNPAKVLDNAGHLTFTIKRSDTSGPAVVYASVVQDQGFTNNGDYTFVNDTEVNFAPGVASVKVSVGIIDTGAPSGSEVFRFIIQQHRTDPVSTFLASDKFTITNTTAPAAAAMPPITFADIAPAGPNSGAANSGSPSTYLPGAIAADEQSHVGGQLLYATGHSGGSLFAPASGANHDSLLPALR